MEFYDDNEDVMNSSLFQTEEDSSESYFNDIYKNTSLKTGIVLEVYEIDNKLNLNKKVPEYDVLVVEQNKTSTLAPTIYKNCITIDGFGGVADFFEYKLRPASVKEEEGEKTPVDTNFKKQYGSMVLLLCLDGSTDKGIIIKSVPHQGRSSNLTKENGLHLEGEYNGLNWQINKSGELTVTFKSRTNDKGEPQNTGAGGSFLKMDKTGSIELNDGLSSSFKMDKSTQTMTLESGLDLDISSVGDVSVESGGNIAALASNFSLNTGQGTAAINTLTMEMSILGEGTIESTLLDIKAQAKMGVEAPLLSLKGNLIQMQGDLIEMKGSLILLGGAGGLPAPTFQTQYIGIGNLGAPVISAILGPFSSNVFVK